jgi:ATP phosphoribosyltransferase
MAAGAPQKDIDDLLADAKFDCHRARHDAIDAATSKIAIDLEIMVGKLGYEVILPVHPQFPHLVRELQAIRTKITVSRQDRENREAIYSVIEATDFPNLVKSYEEMQASEHIMISIAKRRRRSEVWGVVGTILGAIGLGAGYLFWKFPIAP